jgi:hypothetical protein
MSLLIAAMEMSLGKQKRDKEETKEIPLDIPKEDEDIDPNNINFDDLD